MRLGATLAHLSPGPPYPVAEWARRLAGEGFDSLWTPQVIGRGALVPDPFVTLAVAATATDGVELGTATVQVPLHHPADLAHRVLSLRSREFDGWLASAYRRTPDQIIAAHERYRATGGRRAIVCAVPLFGESDLGPTGEVLQRYAEAGFDDAVVLIQPGGPDPGQVRKLLP